MTLILASKSERRHVLLRFLVDDFTVDAVPIDEVAPRALDPGEAVELIARKKALAVCPRHPEAWVLAADTVVLAHEELMGKARDEAMLRLHLAQLSGHTHQVWTGVSLAWNGQAVDGARALSAVRIDRMPADVVDRYARSGQWIGKAGGYGIQDAALQPYVHVQAGPWSNVVGLPLALTRDLLHRNRIPCRDPPTEGYLQDHNPFQAGAASAPA
ncbi:MAG: Maf family protein [Thermoplasmatota archaeon]